MLADLITSKSRVKLLNVFLTTPYEMYHVRECVRKTGDEINAVRRELQFLEKRDVENPERVTMKNGKPAMKAKCPVCGTGMYKIGSK